MRRRGSTAFVLVIAIAFLDCAGLRGAPVGVVTLSTTPVIQTTTVHRNFASLSILVVVQPLIAKEFAGAKLALVKLAKVQRNARLVGALLTELANNGLTSAECVKKMTTADHWTALKVLVMSLPNPLHSAKPAAVIETVSHTSMGHAQLVWVALVAILVN